MSKFELFWEKSSLGMQLKQLLSKNRYLTKEGAILEAAMYEEDNPTYENRLQVLRLLVSNLQNLLDEAEKLEPYHWDK